MSSRVCELFGARGLAFMSPVLDGYKTSGNERTHVHAHYANAEQYKSFDPKRVINGSGDTKTENVLRFRLVRVRLLSRRQHTIRIDNDNNLLFTRTWKRNGT